MASNLTVLVLGDVVGNAGCRAVVAGLPTLIKKHGADVVIVNGENAAEGFGITEAVAADFFAAGAHVITTGNHVWHHREIFEFLDREPRVLRPANYPGGNPGTGAYVVDVRGTKVLVADLQGRVRMRPIDCPFKKAREILKKQGSGIKLRIVDFHAESAEEKESMALYLDGDVSLVFGTHTHVQTADERILPKGTAYISDVGSTASVDSIIGFEPDVGVRRVLTQMPLKNEVSNNKARISGIAVKLESESGKAVSITRIFEESLV